MQAHSGAAELGPYRHYMQKEIFEQPRAIADTLEGVQGITPELFGDGAYKHLQGQVDRVLILACGTSYYSGSTAKYWLESIAKHPHQRGDCQRIPLPRQRARPAHPGRHHQPERRNGRHPGRAEARPPRACPTRSPSATWPPAPWCANAAGLHHPRRRGSGRGQHQGLHHPAGRPVPADPGPGPGARPPERRAGSRPPEGHAPPARGPAGRAGAGAPGGRPGPKPSPARKTPSSWAAACTTPLRWKARSSSRRSATSTPRPTRPAN